MRRAAIVLGIVFCLALSGYVAGRAYERAAQPRSAATPPPAVAENRPVAPAAFGLSIHERLERLEFREVFENVRRADPEQRQEWLRQIEGMPANPRKVAALCAFLRALVQVDAHAAGDAVVNLKRYRSSAMQAVVEAAPPAAMPHLLDMLLRLPHEVRTYQEDHLLIALDQWAHIDPEAVAKFLDEHERFRTRDSVSSFVFTWAALDRDAAWAWLQQLPESTSGDAVRDWLDGWYSSEPDAASAWAEQNSGDARFKDAVLSMAVNLFEQDAARTRDYVSRLPSREMRQEALELLVADYSSRYDRAADLRKTADLLTEFPAEEWPDDLSRFCDRWRDSDVGELFRWLLELPSPYQQKIVESIPTADSEHPEKDLVAALRLPPSDVRSAILRQLLRDDGSSERAGDWLDGLKLARDDRAELQRWLRQSGDQ